MRRRFGVRAVLVSAAVAAGLWAWSGTAGADEHSATVELSTVAEATADPVVESTTVSEPTKSDAVGEQAGDDATVDDRAVDEAAAIEAVPDPVVESTTITGPIVSSAVTPKLSVPLRDIGQAGVTDASRPEIHEQQSEDIAPQVRAAAGGPTDPLLALGTAIATGDAPPLIGSFDGMGCCFTGGDGNPPDTVGDIGPNHYVQMVNTSIIVFNRSGGLLAGPVAINSLWAGAGGLCEANNDGDPIVLYDQLADRWLVSRFATPNPYAECIAISQTPDPTSTYYLYEFPIANFPDYPKLGIWPDAYYMSTQRGGFNNNDVFAFDRAKMLVGAPAQAVTFFVSPTVFLLPADLEGPTPPPVGTPNFFATFANAQTPGGSSPATIEVYGFSVDWVNPASSTFTKVAGVPIADFGYLVCPANPGACIPQPAPGETLDSLSELAMYRTVYRNFGGHATLLGNFTVDVGANRAGIRFWELRNEGSGWVLHQEGTFAPGAEHRWTGSIAMDQSGNIALGYSVSSATLFPAIRYTVHEIGDPLGTMRTEVTLFAGGGVQQNGGNRWGDYSSLNVDPVDDCTFWYTNSYYPETTGDVDWDTRIGFFKVAGCGLPANLVLVKSADVARADVGEQVTFTLTYANTGSGGASGVEITETVPAGTSFVGPNVWAGCILGAPAGTVCTYAVGFLAGGAGGTVQFIVLVTEAGLTTLTNTSSITGEYAVAGISAVAAATVAIGPAPQLVVTPRSPAPLLAAATLPLTGGSPVALLLLALALLALGGLCRCAASFRVARSPLCSPPG